MFLGINCVLPRSTFANYKRFKSSIGVLNKWRHAASNPQGCLPVVWWLILGILGWWRFQTERLHRCLNPSWKKDQVRSTTTNIVIRQLRNMWLSQSLEDQKIWSDTTNYAGCIIHKPSGLVVACCQVIPVKVLPLKRWLIRHPNLLKYEREYSKILVTYFVASDEIASLKPTSKCRFWRWIHVTFLDDISHHTCFALFPRRA